MCSVDCEPQFMSFNCLVGISGNAYWNYVSATRMIWEENTIIWFNYYMSPVYGTYIENANYNTNRD